MPSTLAIGIDVGGTAIKAGLVSDSGQIVSRDGLDTLTSQGPAAIISQMASLVGRLRAGHDVAMVGVGMPGTLDVANGVVHGAPNLPGWVEYPLANELSRHIGLPVVLENDANCAAIGEHACGAGSGVRHMVLLTLGTGVGGGNILDGRLWRGADGSAGEWGHVIVHSGGRRCNCGQLGCLEAYASASNTAHRAAEVVRAGRPSSLASVLRERELNGEDVVDAARSGDRVAVEIWRETCHYLAVACINIQHSVNPNRVVLGGGMSKAGAFLLDHVNEEVELAGSKIVGRLPDIRLATLGNQAGFVGAALNAVKGRQGI